MRKLCFYQFQQIYHQIKQTKKDVIKQIKSVCFIIKIKYKRKQTPFAYSPHHSQMLARLSLNQKKSQSHCQNSSQNYHQNEKQNNQNHKNLNNRIGKRTSRLSNLENVAKNLEQQPCVTRNYQSNADLKLSLNVSLASELPGIDGKKSKLSSIHYQHGYQINQNFQQHHRERSGIQVSSSSQQSTKYESSIVMIPSPSTEKSTKVTKKTNSQTFCELYGERIIKECETISENKLDILKKHEITTLLRARMLDWMVEVMKSYKFTDKTYFTGVELLDRFFQESKSAIPVTKLHIAGVIAMFIATKMEEIYPLKIKTVYEKIVHKKIDRDSLVNMEMQMFEVLNNKVNSWTFFDLAILKVTQNQNLLFAGQNPSESEKEAALKKFQEVLSFVSKCIMYDYDLYTKYSMNTLSDAVIQICWKLCKVPSGYEGMNCLDREQVRKCKEEVISSYSGFKQNFKGLGNLFKFTDEKTVTLMDIYCFEEKKL